MSLCFQLCLKASLVASFHVWCVCTSEFNYFNPQSMSLLA